MSQDNRTVEVRCSSCGTTNRIPVARVGDDPRCGRCKQPVFPRQPVEVGDAEFAAEVERQPIPVLVDFWAPWCAPCRALAPTLAQLAAEQGGRLKVVKLNVDDNPVTAGRFGIRSIPALKLFKGARVVEELVGALPGPQLRARIEPHL